MKHLAILIVLLVPAAARAAGTGYLDTDRAISECADGKRAISELKKMDDDCRAEEAKKKPTVRTNVDEERLQKCLQGVDKRRAELVRPIAEKVRATLPGIAKKHGFTAIMPATSAAWVAPGLDITEDVIKAVDALPKVAAGRDLNAELAAARAAQAAAEAKLDHAKADLDAFRKKHGIQE